MNQTTHRSGFTLLEVMLALTLGTLVIGVSTTVALQSVAMRRDVAHRLEERAERRGVLVRFETDVRSLVTWAPDAGQVVAIRKNEDEVDILSIVVLEDVDDPGSLLRRRMPARVTYRLVSAPEDSQSRQLVRRSELLIEGNGVREEVIAKGLRDARVDVFEEDEWRTGANDETPRPLPKALRLTCVWDDGKSAPSVNTSVINADHSLAAKEPHK